jgi:hypothetical protein
MAAPFKSTRVKTITAIAAEVVEAIKKYINAQDSEVRECKVEVLVMGHGVRPFGNALPTDYRDVTIKVGKTEWSGLSDIDVSRLKYELDKHVRDFDLVERGDILFNWGNFTPDVEGFPRTFRSFGKPCRAFVILSKLVAKKYGIKLGIGDLYEVRLFGKRGEYDESGKREYIAFRNSTCQYLVDLIKGYGRKRTKCEVTTIDSVEDLEYSRYYETECYGMRTRTLKVVATAKAS